MKLVKWLGISVGTILILTTVICLIVTLVTLYGDRDDNTSSTLTKVEEHFQEAEALWEQKLTLEHDVRDLRQKNLELEKVRSELEKVTSEQEQRILLLEGQQKQHLRWLTMVRERHEATATILNDWEGALHAEK